MIRNSLCKRERLAAWCRGRAGLIAFTLCIAIIFVFVGVYLVNQASPKNNLESFSCHFSSSNQTFSVEVEVELSDGMDQDEAISVAASALKEVLVVNSKEQYDPIKASADLDPYGVWTVKVKCTHSITTWSPGHWGSMGTANTMESFVAVIDPINLTIECSLQVIEHH